MCGGTAGDIIKGAQKETDKAIKSVQSAADSALGNTSKPSGGKGSYPVFNPNFSMPTIDINIPTPNLDQDLAAPVQPVIDAAVDVTTTVPVQAVEQITKIDAPKVVESVAKETILAPVKAAETVVKAAEPVAQAAAQVVQQPVTAVEEIAKIDVPKVVENVVKQAATTVTETPKMVVQIAENAVLKPTSNLAMDLTEKAKDALELTWENIISPFQPGTTEGTVAAEPAAANLDATEATGNEAVFGDIETSTTKADKLTEEERLRRIRRLMLNRYGREDTILTGAKDP